MKIAIIEVCSSTHYTLTNALIKTYSTDSNNQIVVYTTEFIAKILRDGGLSNNTQLVVLKEGQDATAFFNDIEKTPFDRLHICTVEDYYDQFKAFNPQVKTLYFHIHDIDTWFVGDVKSSFKNLLFNIQHRPNKIRETARFVRDVLVRKPARDQFLAQTRNRNHAFVVLSHRQKTYLSQFVAAKDIIVFPSLINEGVEKIAVKTETNGKIRICIPGVVTDTRRDYSGLFLILEGILPQIKDKLVFDFLGFIDKTEPHLLGKIQNLEKKGLTTHYSVEFVDAQTFDESLDKADILLNNQKVTVSHTGQYGMTKDSGMLFNIVRGAKPAIFPAEYAVDKDFEAVLLSYASEEALKNILLDLANGQISLDKYKAKAVALAQDYTPKSLYKRLV
jgi:hypothetical protein